MAAQETESAPAENPDERAASAHSWVPVLVFTAAFFLYSLLVVNPVLVYQCQQPPFLWNEMFLKEYLAIPGGISEALGAFLAQSLQFSLPGALVMTALGLALVLLTRRFLRRLCGLPRPRLLQLWPGIFLLALHGNCRHPLTYDAGLLLCLGAINVYAMPGFRSTVLRAAAFFVLAPVLCYAAGAFVLPFAAAAGLWEWLEKRRPLNGLLCAAAALLPWLAARFLFVIRVADAYLFPLIAEERLSYTPPGAPVLAVLYFPLCLGGAAVWRRRAFPRRAAGKLLPRRIPAMGAGLFILAAAAAVLYPLDWKMREMLRTDYHASRGQWRETLAAARRAGENTIFNKLLIAFHANRALFHQGRLLDEMFTMPQEFGTRGLVLPKGVTFTFQMPKSDFYYELGLMNKAQHWAHEALTMWGETPRALRRLARVNILNGEIRAAEKFLAVLEQAPFHGREARRCRRQLREGTIFEHDPELRRLRAMMIHQDFEIRFYEELYCLERMTGLNPGNKMAYEYLMAYYLLAGELGKFVKKVERLKNFDFKTIPRHMEEALLLYTANAGPADFDFGGLKVSEETRRRFAGLYETIQRHGGSHAAARKELEQTHQGTYWFYMIYNNPFKQPAIELRET